MTSVTIVKQMASYFNREYHEVLERIVYSREDMQISLANVYLKEKQEQEHIHKGGLYFDIAISYLCELLFGEAKANLELAINEDKIYYKENYTNAPAYKLYSQLFPEGEAIIANRVINIIEEIIKDKITGKRERIAANRSEKPKQE